MNLRTNIVSLAARCISSICAAGARFAPPPPQFPRLLRPGNRLPALPLSPLASLASSLFLVPLLALAGLLSFLAPSASVITAARRPMVLGALLIALATILLSPEGPVLPRFAEAQTTQTTLVGNTGQSPSATAVITQQYAMGFRLGNHGQGYEISGVSVDLAAVPSDLTVSLWIGSHPGHSPGNRAQRKLFDFTNPAAFRVGLNTFTAPAGAFAYPNINYHIVLSGFGSSLSIKETTSDAEDAGGQPGAILFSDARQRALGSTGRWGSSTSRGSVLLLAVEGTTRNRGILASSLAQPWGGDQEIISAGDDCCFEIRVGSADRYLIRGLAMVSDDTTDKNGFFGIPFDFRQGSGTLFIMPYASAQGNLVSGPAALTSPAGISEWAAPQGATVAGGSSTTYNLKMDVESIEGDDEGSTRGGVVLSRIFGRDADAHDAQYYDTPTPPGVTFRDRASIDLQIPHMAVLGEPLHAMVQNLGQTDNGYASADNTTRVISQRFTTGPAPTGHRLVGIGVNIEGSGNNYPDGPDSVSVAVYSAHSNGKPDELLFDLVSPDDYSDSAGAHHFFEGRPGTTLEPNTPYVMVWRHVNGAGHRLVRTASPNEDSGKLTGSDISNVYYRGADLDNLISGGNALAIAVYTQDINVPATGRPIVTPAEGLVGLLHADTSDIVDANGLPGRSAYSYEWFRVDGATGAETNIGANVGGYQVVNADIGHRIKVRVSFLDQGGTWEVLTSEPFGPIDSRHFASRPNVTLVGNTGQLPSTTAMITQQYAVPFRLGKHGQGYEISGVSIDLAAVPSDLTVSLWIGSHPSHNLANAVQRKLFDFTSPSAFQVGLNKFTAPAGAFAYPNINYYIVLSGFDTSLSIKETTSNDEDAGGEPGAILFSDANVRALGSTGRWASFTLRSSVLLLAVEGSRRDRGILASSFAQPWEGDQEIISVGDDCCFDIRVGSADRYLIRGLAVLADDTTAEGGFFGLPFDFKKGSDQLFSLAYTSAQGNLVTGPKALTSPAGISEWAAPQGATVAGGSLTTYTLKMDIKSIEGDTAGDTRGGIVTGRIFGHDDDAHDAQYYDTPMATGVTFSERGNIDLEIPHMAVRGEPLHAMVENFGQTDNSYHGVDADNKVVSQGFTTGTKAGEFAYRLVGIGVNIEGSDDMSVAQIPDGPDSVSVAVHADSNGQPGEKLFDLISPDEYAAGHSFFEAPPGTALKPNTSFVMVWRHVSGTGHRLQKTRSDGEDSGKLTGSSIANAFYHGADLNALSASALSNALEIVVYTQPAMRPFVPGGVDVRKGWLHIPEDKNGEPLVEAGDQFRLLFVTHGGTTATSGNIEDYNDEVQLEAGQTYTHWVIQRTASDFRAVVCTEAVDARTNTGMTDGIGVPIHWLDGGWENRLTLIANSYDEFYGGKWTNNDWAPT